MQRAVNGNREGRGNRVAASELRPRLGPIVDERLAVPRIDGPLADIEPPRRLLRPSNRAAYSDISQRYLPDLEHHAVIPMLPFGDGDVAVLGQKNVAGRDGEGYAVVVIGGRIGFQHRVGIVALFRRYEQ